MRIQAVNLSNMVLDELMHLTFLKIIADEEVIQKNKLQFTTFSVPVTVASFTSLYDQNIDHNRIFFFTTPPTKTSNNGVLSNLTLPLTSSCLVHLNPSLTVKKNNCSPFVNNGNSTEGFQLLGPSPVYCIIPLTNGIDLDANIVF